MNRLTKTLTLIGACILSLGLITTTAYANGSELDAGTPSWNEFSEKLPGACSVESVSDPDQEFVICMPEPWNGVLMIYAHGYTPVYPRAGAVTPWNLSDVEFAALVGLPDQPGLIETALQTGAAFAMTSYSTQGWAIKNALTDIPTLYNYFYETRVAPSPPPLLVMTGASEGALVTTMAVEKLTGTLPSMLPIIGGLAACGPLAGTEWQVEYLGDFRVWFDHFFAGVLPGDVANVPENAWRAWDPELDENPADEDLVGAISQAIIDDFAYNRGRKTKSLFLLTGAPIGYEFWKADAYYPSAVQALYYSIWGTNDLIAKAGGQPYDNSDEWLLHFLYPYEAEAEAEAYIRSFYTPSGDLGVPLVTLHTTRDPAVPVQHEFIYAERAEDSGNLTTLIVPRYGHCNFKPYELQTALALLQYKISQNASAVAATASGEMNTFNAVSVGDETLNEAGVYEFDLAGVEVKDLMTLEEGWPPPGRGNGPSQLPPGQSDDKPGNGPNGQ
jgi:hypothetical protein